MQEEERERRDNYCPAVSEVRTEGIVVDNVTSEMLKSIGMANLPGVVYRGNKQRGDNKQHDQRGARRQNNTNNRYRPSARRQ